MHKRILLVSSRHRIISVKDDVVRAFIFNLISYRACIFAYVDAHASLRHPRVLMCKYTSHHIPNEQMLVLACCFLFALYFVCTSMSAFASAHMRTAHIIPVQDDVKSYLGHDTPNFTTTPRFAKPDSQPTQSLY